MKKKPIAAATMLRKIDKSICVVVEKGSVRLVHRVVEQLRFLCN